MRVIVCTKDNEYYKSLCSLEGVDSTIEFSRIGDWDGYSFVGFKCAVLVDAETFKKEDVVYLQDKFVNLFGAPLIITRCVRYTDYSEYSKISTDFIVAQGTKELVECFNKLLVPNLDVLSFGDWKLVLASKELLYNDVCVTRLNKKSVFLLQKLIEHKNDVVNREDLMKVSWTDLTYKKSRSMDVYIVQLKHVFEIDPRIHIENRYGVGFMLVVEE